MSKYQSDSMKSFQRAIADAKFQSEVGLRMSESYRNLALSTLSPLQDAFRPLFNQAENMSIAMVPIKLDLPTIKFQTELNNSITKQMEELSKELQRPALEALKEIANTDSILSQMKMRSILYSASTVNLDAFVTNEDAQIVQDYSKSVITNSYIATHEVAGIIIWTYTAYQFMSDPTLLESFILVLSYIYTNGLLLKEIKDED